VRLFIVRHGKAEQGSPTGLDEDRPLKPRGERQAEWLGTELATAGIRLIVASRFERAIATAQLIQRRIGASLHLSPALEAGKSPSEAVTVIQDNRSHDPLALVGHNPQLSELVRVLTHGSAGGDAGLRTGEAAVLEVNPDEPVGSGRLVARLRMDDDD
jgi:phosphohistidine phosphatase